MRELRDMLSAVCKDGRTGGLRVEVKLPPHEELCTPGRL